MTLGKMTPISVYLWGLSVGAVGATAFGAVGLHNGMPLISDDRNILPPKNVVYLVGTVLCCALVWPYLLFIGAYALWARLRRPHT